MDVIDYFECIYDLDYFERWNDVSNNFLTGREE